MLVNLRNPAEIACFRRNLTGKRCWIVDAEQWLKIWGTILVHNALSVMSWEQPSNQSINPFYARSHPSVTCLEEHKNYCHIEKLNTWSIVYRINCFHLLQSSLSSHILPPPRFRSNQQQSRWLRGSYRDGKWASSSKQSHMYNVRLQHILMATVMTGVWEGWLICRPKQPSLSRSYRK